MMRCLAVSILLTDITITRLCNIMRYFTALKMKNCDFLAHLSRRLTGELIGYPWIRRPSVFRSHFQTSSPLKPLGQSKPTFMWCLLGKGERKFV